MTAEDRQDLETFASGTTPLMYISFPKGKITLFASPLWLGMLQPMLIMMKGLLLAMDACPSRDARRDIISNGIKRSRPRTTDDDDGDEASRSF